MSHRESSFVPGRHAGEAEAPVAEPEFQITTSALSEEEIAAVTAVVQASIDAELSEEDHGALLEQSAWDKDRRGIRKPLVPGAGQWRRY